MPTMMAVGVASPNEHGQAMTNTDTMAIKPCVSPLSGYNTSHAARLSSAMPMMAGTNTAAMRSTIACTGTLLFWAFCTMRTM